MSDHGVEIRNDVAQLLTANKGESFTLQMIANKIRCGIASVRYAVAQLEKDSTVRVQKGERHKRYYIPTDEQAAQVIHEQKSKWAPLKPREDHANVIQAIRAERNLYPSIG